LYQIHICGVGGKTLFMMMKTLKLEISSFSYITVQSESINRVLTRVEIICVSQWKPRVL